MGNRGTRGRVARSAVALIVAVGLSISGVQPAAADTGVDQGCTVDHPVRIPIGSSQYDPTAPPLNKIVVCVLPGLQSAMFFNNSDVVWSQYNRVDRFWTTTSSKLFREHANSNGVAILTPGESALLVSLDAVNDFDVNVDMTALWLAQRVIESRLSSVLKSTAVRILARSSVKKAIAACGLAAKDAAGGFVDIETAEQTWDAALNAAALVPSCATAWDKARSDVGAKQYPTLTKGVVEAGEAAGGVKLIRSTTKWLFNVCALIPRWC